MTSLTFSNKLTIPVLGLGTWNLSSYKAGSAVKAALKSGYRHIDCAFVYSNEKSVGDALESAITELKLRREDIFITSKCWCTYMRPERVRECCEKSLRDLKLSYLDLYLIHWPVALKPDDSGFDNVSLVSTWKGMEQLVDDGLVRMIGISNFSLKQVDLILNTCRIQPVNLQIEIHCNFPNTQLVEYAQSKGLVVTAYAPLGSPGGSPGRTNLLKQPWVLDIAKKYKKTPAQVLLRCLVQRNLVVIPKSATTERIEENADIFDFELSNEDMHVLFTSGINQRQFQMDGFRQSKEYPFSDD